MQVVLTIAITLNLLLSGLGAAFFSATCGTTIGTCKDCLKCSSLLSA
jgi:hypothetical protein